MLQKPNQTSTINTCCSGGSRLDSSTETDHTLVISRGLDFGTKDFRYLLCSFWVCFVLSRFVSFFIVLCQSFTVGLFLSCFSTLRLSLVSFLFSFRPLLSCCVSFVFVLSRYFSFCFVLSHIVPFLFGCSWCFSFIAALWTLCSLLSVLSLSFSSCLFARSRVILFCIVLSHFSSSCVWKAIQNRWKRPKGWKTQKN